MLRNGPRTSSSRAISRPFGPPSTGYSQPPGHALPPTRRPHNTPETCPQHRRKDAAARLERHHHRVVNMRRHFLHQVSGELVKTHDRLVVETSTWRACWPGHQCPPTGRC
ncbi:transposase [Mycobacterium haemophilum]|uniref:transposase n=1 Tax=Mycobacterium haemophilum TaxID=29311 RepID=UPI00143984FA|nr:transposase [Mycobacterium haemophilum DSM 44634]